MSQTKQEIEAEITDNARRVCDALKSVLRKNKISAAELARLTGTTEQTVQRATRFQEPKASWLFFAEDRMGLERGTVYAEAELMKPKTLPEDWLAVDKRLHPVFQSSAPGTVASWVSASESASSS